MDDEKKILKSIILSSPEILQVCQLNEQYKKFVGKNIPFVEYGYTNLLEFLHSLSDVLIVKGNDLQSPVQLTFPVASYKRLNRRKRKKGKKSCLKSDNKDTSNKNKQVAFHDISSTVNLRTTPDPSDMNTCDHVDHNNEKIPSLMSIDTRKIAAIRQKIVIDQINYIIKRMETEKKELRYPKSAPPSDKNGRKWDIPFQTSVQAGSSTSVRFEKNTVFGREAYNSTILEYHRTRGNISNRLRHIPSKKQGSSSIPTDKLVDLSDGFEKLRIIEDRNNELIPFQISAGRSTLLSIMDEPIPPFLPEVPVEFTKPKSDDLIDFDTVVLNPVLPSAVRPPFRPHLFVDVIRMVQSLELSGE